MSLEDHHRLVRRAIEDHGGTVVKTEGDAFFAVFAAAADAVVAAASKPSARWRLIPGRTGSPSGPGWGSTPATEPVGGDDYVGIDVHRAARIAAAAHGGQTVLSEATVVLAERGIPDDLTLVDLGKHRLKDLAQPEAIFQLVVPGLQDEFPALRTLDAIPNNLPLDRHQLRRAGRASSPRRCDCSSAPGCSPSPGPAAPGRPGSPSRSAPSSAPPSATGCTSSTSPR